MIETAEQRQALLTGQHVQLYPYLRGLWPPETLFTLWNLMRQEGAENRVFYGGPPSTVPYPTSGDLVTFTRHFDPEFSKRHTFIAQSLKTPGDVAGLLWFDDIVPGCRAAGSIWMRRKYWGQPAREATKLAARYWFAEHDDCPAIWAYTPWRIAQRNAEAAGFVTIARLPKYVLIDGERKDLLILRLDREAVDGEH